MFYSTPLPLVSPPLIAMDGNTDDFLLEVFAQFILEDDIENQEEEDISISMSHFPDVLAALGVEKYYLGPESNPAKLNAIKKSLDPHDEGRIRFNAFHEFMPFVFQQAKEDEEENENDDVEVDEKTREDYLLFTNGEDRPIVFSDLERAFKEANFDVPEVLLRRMLQLGPPGSNRTGDSVSFEDYAYIQKIINSTL